ncbi:MAG: hypothetical protein IAF08_11880, partial [Rhizobacter sp.]|nr:hypothetical protein [Chlorobiales bacterium]
MFHLRSFHTRTIYTLLLFTLIALNGGSAALAKGGGDPPAKKSVPTGLGGFYDYQTVGASPLLIATNPANPLHLHAIYTQSFDSLNVQGSRRVGYAYSLDGGLSWQQISSLGSGGDEGFPSLSLLPNGAAAVACGAGVPAQTKIFLDAGEGARQFSPLSTAPTGSDDPLMPMLAAMTTSNLQVIASRPASRSVHIATLDYLTFGSVLASAAESASLLAKPQRLTSTPIPWGQSLTDPDGDILTGDCHTIARSADGHKVALVHRGSMAAEGASVRYAESVDSGKTFGAFQNIMPFPFVVGADSVAARGGLDAAYNGDELQIVFGAAKFTSGIYAEQQASIYHWSAANGLKKMIDA